MFIVLALEFLHFLQTVHHIWNKSVTKVLINSVAHFHTIYLNWNVDCDEWWAEIKAERWTWVPTVCRWGNLCEVSHPWSISWRRTLERVQALLGVTQSCQNHCVFIFKHLSTGEANSHFSSCQDILQSSFLQDGPMRTHHALCLAKMFSPETGDCLLQFCLFSVLL